MPGRAHGVDEVLRGVAPVEEVDPDARGPDVRGGAVTEGDRARDEIGGVAAERPLVRRALDERAELVRGTGRAQLLLRLDPEAAQERVGGAVEPADGPRHRGREGALEGLHGPGGRHRDGEREVLGDQLADQHGDERAQQQRDQVRGRRQGRPAHPERRERLAQELPDRRLGEEADGEVGDGDPELGAAELGRQRAQPFEDPCGLPITRLRGALHGGPVDGDEGELGSHEDAAGEHEEEGRQEEQPLGHQEAIVPVVQGILSAPSWLTRVAPRTMGAGDRCGRHVGRPFRASAEEE